MAKVSNAFVHYRQLKKEKRMINQEPKSFKCDFFRYIQVHRCEHRCVLHSRDEISIIHGATIGSSYQWN